MQWESREINDMTLFNCSNSQTLLQEEIDQCRVTRVWKYNGVMQVVPFCVCGGGELLMSDLIKVAPAPL